MELLQKHKILFFSLIIVNLIITIASYFVFNTYSYKGPTNTEERIYEININRNFEFTDLDLLTKQACFSNCNLFEQNVEKVFFKILSKQIWNKRLFEYKASYKDDFNQVYNNKIIVSQFVCLIDNTCEVEINTVFQDTLNSLVNYLNTHIDELIFLTSYNKNNDIYKMSQRNNTISNQVNDYNKRLDELSRRIILDDNFNLGSTEDAVNQAKKILDIIDQGKKNINNQEIIMQSLEDLMQELLSFKENRISKIPNHYSIQLVEIKKWWGGLKESPFRSIYYNIPNIIKSLIIFLSMLLISIIIIRIFDISRYSKTN